MEQTISSILKQGNFIVDDDVYISIKLPSEGIVFASSIVAQIAEPFAVLILDAFEITLIISQEAYTDFADRIPSHVKGELYKLITLDVELVPTLTGLMAILTGALAQAGVPILSYAAYSRDHICVPAKYVETALTTLRKLQESIN